MLAWSPYTFVDAAALAHVVGHALRVVDMVTDRHPLTATPAYRQSLQQRRPFARGAEVALTTVGLSIVVEDLYVLLELFPRDVTLVRVTNEGGPFVHG
ncbi:hypothetical protein AWB67_06892 [Caballeronia terrestris]|uniref:Uncharacterized protein n=1 Tax=Caballeronia terrestris TaxID=1226301 RepID=A0A158KVW0_9BURK|nr:hypothetical protein AWB67_06892 [Caballeronia terrestris]